MKPEQLMTYCGGFCGSCARSASYTAFRDAASVLAELADPHGFQHWMPDAAEEFSYAEFRKGLDFFADPNSWLVCKKGCRGGDDGPPFCVRECCKQHNVDICFDCGDFPCDQTKSFEGIEKKAEEYAQLGREQWLRRQARMADEGFEAHTGNYYQVKRSATLPEG